MSILLEEVSSCMDLIKGDENPKANPTFIAPTNAAEADKYKFLLPFIL